MAKQSDSQPATFESVWASFRETDRLIKESREEFDQDLKKSRENFEREMKESREDFDRRMKQHDDFLKESEQKRRESNEDFDRRMKKHDELLKESEQKRRESNEDFDRRMKKHDELLGSWSHNLGSFAEEYYSNSFDRGKRNFFGETFDTMEKNAKGFKKGYEDEYDILLINGKSVGIVEVKFKAHKDQLSKVLRKVETFRENFPYYAGHQVYLGLASLAFYPELEQECIDHGIAMVKQIGDIVIVNEAHLRAH